MEEYDRMLLFLLLPKWVVSKQYDLPAEFLLDVFKIQIHAIESAWSRKNGGFFLAVAVLPKIC